MACPICEALKDKSAIVYEDERTAVFLLNKSLTVGHLKVVPKKHINILENMPDELLPYCMLIANRFVSILFETFGLEGTNILVQNGVDAGQEFPHFSIDIIPRKQNDNLALAWEPTKPSSDSLKGMQGIIKEALQSNTPAKQPAPKQEPKKEKVEGSEKDNYLIRHLKRTP